MPKNKRNCINTANVAQLYKSAAEQYGELPAFASRITTLQWEPVTFNEMYERGLNIATGLIELGVKACDHVGLFADNRLEWMLADYGVQLCGAADVPRGRDISNNELSYIINHAEIEIAFAENKDIVNRLLLLKETLPNLKKIIVLDKKTPTIDGIITLDELHDLGKSLRGLGDKRAEERIANIKSDDLFTLIYTSGTTGTPKGVMLTHENMMSQVRTLPGRYSCNDRILSVLPIWHAFERVIEMYSISFGGCTYYSRIQTLSEDMKNVEPTFMASAPRLWEKIHEKIIKNVKDSHPVRQILFHIAYFLAKQYKNSEYFITNKYLKTSAEPKWKRMLLYPFQILRWLLVLPWYGFFNVAVLERIRMGAGGSLSSTISGGGALPSHIDKFFNYVGIPVMEGYGLTETTPVVSVRPKINLIIGTVGPPITDTEIRIVCLQSGNILYPDSTCPNNGKGKRGEILVKGPQVMKGYYKDEQLTNATIIDGWLKTGDMGMITFNDCLKILGRSKATIVLSSGENVEPEPLEMQLQQSQYIEQCMVVGQDQKFLGLLLVPELNAFKKRGINAESLSQLATLPEANSIIREEIRKMMSPASGFKRYEQIRDFRMLDNTFEVGHELTNLYKVKRHVVNDKYNHIINDLFLNLSSKN